MKNPILRNRRWVAFLFGLVVLATMAAGVRWNRTHTVQSQPPIGNVVTILVAPFAVIGDGTEPWSGGGLAEEVRTALRADRSVVLRRSEPTMAGATPKPAPVTDDAREIAAARRVGADYVLTGTVGRRERGSEIGLRLIRAADASTAWAGIFWRSPADFPSFAADLAAAVTEAIRAERDRQARAHEPEYGSTKRTRR